MNSILLKVLSLYVVLFLTTHLKSFEVPVEHVINDLSFWETSTESERVISCVNDSEILKPVDDLGIFQAIDQVDDLQLKRNSTQYTSILQYANESWIGAYPKQVLGYYSTATTSNTLHDSTSSFTELGPVLFHSVSVEKFSIEIFPNFEECPKMQLLLPLVEICPFLIGRGTKSNEMAAFHNYYLKLVESPILHKIFHLFLIYFTSAWLMRKYRFQWSEGKKALYQVMKFMMVISSVWLVKVEKSTALSFLTSVMLLCTAIQLWRISLTLGRIWCLSRSTPIKTPSEIQENSPEVDPLINPTSTLTEPSVSPKLDPSICPNSKSPPLPSPFMPQFSPYSPPDPKLPTTHTTKEPIFPFSFPPSQSTPQIAISPPTNSTFSPSTFGSSSSTSSAPLLSSSTVPSNFSSFSFSSSSAPSTSPFKFNSSATTSSPQRPLTAPFTFTSSNTSTFSAPSTAPFNFTSFAPPSSSTAPSTSTNLPFQASVGPASSSSTTTKPFTFPSFTSSQTSSSNSVLFGSSSTQIFSSHSSNSSTPSTFTFGASSSASSSLSSPQVPLSSTFRPTSDPIPPSPPSPSPPTSPSASSSISCFSSDEFAFPTYDDSVPSSVPPHPKTAEEIDFTECYGFPMSLEDLVFECNHDVIFSTQFAFQIRDKGSLKLAEDGEGYVIVRSPPVEMSYIEDIIVGRDGVVSTNERLLLTDQFKEEMEKGNGV